MGFAENLRQVRKQNGLSQEELAELLEVSRQAVSKWEQGGGFPEVEKLLTLSQKLNVSLDYLMADSSFNSYAESADADKSSGPSRILISSFDGKTLVSCYKVMSSFMSKSKKDEPRYALFGVDGSSLWGENSTVLGWYDNEDQLKEEVREIREAMNQGKPTYELVHAVPVKWHWGKIKIDQNTDH